MAIASNGRAVRAIITCLNVSVSLTIPWKGCDGQKSLWTKETRNQSTCLNRNSGSKSDMETFGNELVRYKPLLESITDINYRLYYFQVMYYGTTCQLFLRELQDEEDIISILNWYNRVDAVFLNDLSTGIKGTNSSSVWR